MSNQSPEARVQDQLAQAVASGLLPSKAQDQAEKLLTRLQEPVRLALMGMPKSGKSTLLNLLVGMDVLQSNISLPTLELVYGDDARATCTLADGSQTTLNSVDPQAIAALAPAFVELQMPLPALKKISVLEVVAPADPNALHKASQWAARRCDIALWCTNGFTADEQRIWAQMPDLIKDHGFLMITRYDQLVAQGIFDEVRAAIAATATSEFNKILPVATLEAIAARNPDGTVDKDRLRESGGMALISAVLKQVEQGKRSAVDLAEVLLLQNEGALAAVSAAASPEAEDAEDKIAPEPQSAAPRDAELPRERNPAPAPVQQRPAPAPPAAPPAERVSVGIARLRDIAARRAEERLEPPQVADLKPATREAYQTVVSYIEGEAKALVAKVDARDEGAAAEVMAQAVTHINWLCDYLNENGDDSDASLMRTRDTAFDAADLIQLMHIEKRDSAAIEAIILLLQVKRELQADLAA